MARRRSSSPPPPGRQRTASRRSRASSRVRLQHGMCRISRTALQWRRSKALERADLSIDDIDAVEINEAFASVPIISGRRLGVDMERVNINGGAIALGHPIGASGARMVGTLALQLRRYGWWPRVRGDLFRWRARRCDHSGGARVSERAMAGAIYPFAVSGRRLRRVPISRRVRSLSAMSRSARSASSSPARCSAAIMRPIIVERGANVQENATVHVDPGAPAHIGEYASSAITRSSTVARSVQALCRYARDRAQSRGDWRREHHRRGCARL